MITFLIFSYSIKRLEITFSAKTKAFTMVFFKLFTAYFSATNHAVVGWVVFLSEITGNSVGSDNDSNNRYSNQYFTHCDSYFLHTVHANRAYPANAIATQPHSMISFVVIFTSPSGYFHFGNDHSTCLGRSPSYPSIVHAPSACC